MSTEIEAHKFIHTSLDEILVILRAAKADLSKFDAPKLKEIMEKMKGPLARPLTRYPNVI